MIRESKIRRKSVDLNAPARPSRIRRDPAAPESPPRTLFAHVDFRSREWEIRLAIAGILFFALAICALVIDIGELLGH